MRVVTEEQLATRLSDLEVGEEPRVVASGNFATPGRLLTVLDPVFDRYRLFMLNAHPPLPSRDGVILETPFVGPGMRSSPERLDYLPMRLSLVPQLFERSRPPDIVLLHTSTIQDGKLSLGIEVNILVAAVEHIRSKGGLVVAQLNPRMPYTFGDGELDVDVVDIGVEVDEELPSPSAHTPNPVEVSIGAQVAELVSDGSTIQLGIGTIPDATLQAMTGHRELGVWSEMISDGILELEHHNALDRDRSIVASFLFGSPELYRWADRNPRIRMMRTEVTNDPGMIAKQPFMTSINTALQVDLYAQANASYVHGRIYSGFGGQSDFTVGAMHAHGGRAIIALPSWHQKTDESTVLPTLCSPVTSFQHSAIVTEQGCAHIFGRSQRAQARLIMDQAAHPAARPYLHEEAGKLRLI